MTTRACSLAENQPRKHELKTAATYTTCQQGLQSHMLHVYMLHVYMLQLDQPHSQLDFFFWLLAPNEKK